MTIELIRGDCMEYMAGLPDGAFDLAIVDPPYGIGGGSFGLWGKDRPLRTAYRLGKPDYDVARPPKEYFDELRRVCHECLIWGGNHFADFLPASASWIVWDKKITPGVSLSDCELAWCTIGGRVAKYEQGWCGYLREGERAGTIAYAERVHPNQKPVALYRWLLQNYAKPGWRILDTHLGSGSSAIASYEEGFDFVGIEIDADYIAAARKRFERHTAQGRLFEEAG